MNVGLSRRKQPRKEEEMFPPPDHLGHRGRLRSRFEAGGEAALQDYELLELLLTFAIPHRDVKPYAKRLLSAFGSLTAVLEAEIPALRSPGALPPQAALLLRAAGDLQRRARREELRRGRAFSHPAEAAAFLKEDLGSRAKESFACLYLDQRNHLLSYEVVQEGTVDQTAVYPREIYRRAFELHATGVIVAHNHPAGSLEPSAADRDLTRRLVDAGRALGVSVHDHLILAREGWFSFRQAGLLG